MNQNNGGCGGTSGADIDAVCAISSITLSTANPLLANNFRIHPNPFKNKISITYNPINAERVNYKIFNLHGQLLLQNDLVAEKKIDLSVLKTGIYHIKLTSNSQTITKKLLKL